MKRKIIIAALPIVLAISKIHSQDFVWATAMGSGGIERGTSIALDQLGYIYVAGSFNDSLDCDPSASTYMIYGYGSYVSKQDSLGNLIWAKSFPACTTYCIKSDFNQNVYITGEYFGTADLDPDTGECIPPGTRGLFLVKLDQNGDFVWGGGGGHWSYGNSIFLDDSSNVFLGGRLSLTVDFDFGPGLNNQSAINVNDGFVAKIDSNGQLIWLNHFGTSVSEIAQDPSGNILVFGIVDNSNGPTDFDPGPATYYLNPPVGPVGTFVLKLTDSGGFVWAGCYGSTNFYQHRHGMVADYLGDIYITGQCGYGDRDFDPGWDTHIVTSDGATTDAYLLKLSQFGDFLWVNTLGNSSSNCSGSDIVLDSYQNPIMVGYFGDVVDFDPGLATSNLSTSPLYDAYIVKYNTNGILQWAKNIGASGSDQAHGVATTADGAIFICGEFGNYPIDADPGPANFMLPNLGSVDIFLIKLRDSTASIIGLPNENLQDLLLFPNPFHDRILIEGIEEPSTVTVYNITGKEISMWNLDENNKTIYLAELVSGMYFLKIETTHGTVIKKMLKE